MRTSEREMLAITQVETWVLFVFLLLLVLGFHREKERGTVRIPAKDSAKLVIADSLVKVTKIKDLDKLLAYLMKHFAPDAAPPPCRKGLKPPHILTIKIEQEGKFIVGRSVNLDHSFKFEFWEAFIPGYIDTLNIEEFKNIGNNLLTYSMKKLPNKKTCIYQIALTYNKDLSSNDFVRMQRIVDQYFYKLQNIKPS